MGQVFVQLDLAFTIVFAVELLINVCHHPSLSPYAPHPLSHPTPCPYTLYPTPES